ncbi:hypothetical protein D3C72_1255610 [compost metagenome]
MINDRSVSSLIRNEFFEFLQSFPVLDYFLQLLFRFFQRRGFACQIYHLTSKRQAELLKIFRSSPFQRINRFLHFQGVPDGEAQRLTHIGDNRHRSAADIIPNADHGMSECLGILGGLHKCACSSLHIKHDRIRACCNLLAHNGACDQRNRVNRSRNIPQCIQLLVRRRDITGLTNYGNLVIIHEIREFFLRNLHVEALNSFKLVNRTSGMS